MKSYPIREMEESSVSEKRKGRGGGVESEGVGGVREVRQRVRKKERERVEDKDDLAHKYTETYLRS